MPHIPGPWSVMPTPDDIHTSYKIMYDCVQDHRRIGAVCGVYPKEDGEAKANALLISAAPDLLAALREARDAFAAMEWEGEENWRHWDATRLDQLIAGTRHVVNQAIAQAGGASSWDASMVGPTSG